MVDKTTEEDENVLIHRTNKDWIVFQFPSSQIQRVNSLAQKLHAYDVSPFSAENKYFLNKQNFTLWMNVEKVTSVLPTGKFQGKITRFTETTDGKVKYKFEIDHVLILHSIENDVCPF